MGELEGIGPLLSKEGLGGWLGQQRSNRKIVIVIVIVIVKKNFVSLCLYFPLVSDATALPQGVVLPEAPLRGTRGSPNTHPGNAQCGSPDGA